MNAIEKKKNNIDKSAMNDWKEYDTIKVSNVSYYLSNLFLFFSFSLSLFFLLVRFKA